MKLSIISINRNNAEGLRRTIESVVSQTYTDYEYIVIDGVSTDGSLDVIKQYEDKITYWVSEKDTGIYNAMNKGIVRAKGEYLQFLNSGDWFYSDKVLEEIFMLKRTEDILYGNEIYFYNKQRNYLRVYPEILTFYLFYSGGLTHQAAFIKKKLFDVLYNENNKIVSDWEFYIQKIIFENSSTYYLNSTIVYFDMSGISESAKASEMHADERQKVLKQFLPEKVLLDYEELKALKIVSNISLYPYIQVVSQFSTLKKITKLFLKILLFVTNKNNLISKIK